MQELMDAVQEVQEILSQDLQLVAVPPNEYVIDSHALQAPLTNLYPALHFVHFPVDAVHSLQEVEQEVQVVTVPPNE